MVGSLTRIIIQISHAKRFAKALAFYGGTFSKRSKAGQVNVDREQCNPSEI